MLIMGSEAAERASQFHAELAFGLLRIRSMAGRLQQGFRLSEQGHGLPLAARGHSDISFPMAQVAFYPKTPGKTSHPHGTKEVQHSQERSLCRHQNILTSAQSQPGSRQKNHHAS